MKDLYTDKKAEVSERLVFLIIIIILIILALVYVGSKLTTLKNIIGMG